MAFESRSGQYRVCEFSRERFMRCTKCVLKFTLSTTIWRQQLLSQMEQVGLDTGPCLYAGFGARLGEHLRAWALRLWTKPSGASQSDLSAGVQSSSPEIAPGVCSVDCSSQPEREISNQDATQRVFAFGYGLCVESVVAGLL